MQQDQRERRSKNAARVELDARVEICGQDVTTKPFEAQAVEVSGRGMQVRTQSLPEVGTPLVLRFEHDGREVVVEGDVAWCRKGKHGGEFGVKFTAIDSQSVIALKEICAAQAQSASTPRGVSAEMQAAEEEQPMSANAFGTSVGFGSAVKLHIDGLAAPMKARVVDSGSKRLKVGSRLEFLKLGQPLSMEDVTTGDRRSGKVHSVTVQVDPENQIPQLVVSVRYEGIDDTTPQPAVIDERKRGKGKLKASRSNADDIDADDSDDDGDDDGEHDDDIDDDEELYTAEARLKGRLVALAGFAAGTVSGGVRSVSHGAGAIARTLRTTMQRRAVASEPSAPPRRTSPSATQVSNTATGVRKVNKHRGMHSRSQEQAAGPSPLAMFSRPGPLMAFAAVMLVGGYFLFRTEPNKEFQAQATALVTSPTAVPAPVASFAGAVALNNLPAGAQGPKGIVANVPLFGPTTLATTEPAPVVPGPPRGGIDEYSLSKDQAFDDAPATAAPGRGAAKSAPDSSASETTSFRVGRMQDPVLHRLRLDAPGVALQGEKTANGYSIVIPGRKVMENGSAILNVENRLADVRVNNSPAGAKITFRFSKEPPSFKARLRNDYIEVFINPAPIPAAALKNSALKTATAKNVKRR